MIFHHKNIITREAALFLRVVVLNVIWLANSFAIDESVYRPNYDCIGSDGSFERVFKLGTIKSDSISYPIILTFSSGRNSGNTLLGTGWEMPVFDSKIFQTSENEFLVSVPNGIQIKLLRDLKNKNVLTHPSGWSGKIDMNSITIISPRGYSYKYDNGLLSSITTSSGNVMEVIRSKDSYQLLSKENQKILLSITPSEKKNNTLVGKIDGRDIDFNLTKRPIIHTFNDQRLVESMSTALEEIMIDGCRLFFVNYDVT